jgi:hypothetical protein
MATLRLRCIRCGDWDEMDPTEMYGWGLCSNCWSRHPDLISDPRPFLRWMDRWQRGMERHPTYKALSAALDALESVPHGSLDVTGAEGSR